MEWGSLDLDMLTQLRLKQLITYDPITGLFTNNKTNRLLGTPHNRGYVVLRVDNKLYLAHRLAFLFMEGCFPSKQVDHIDRERSNNKWSNLRHASATENSCNRQAVGVYEYERKGRKGLWYAARIEFGGKIYSTTKRSKKDAENWRREKEIQLFGAFAKDCV